MGSGINNKINEFLCNPKNVKKRRNTRLEKCYGDVNIATAFSICRSHIFSPDDYRMSDLVQLEEELQSKPQKEGKETVGNEGGLCKF